MSKGKDLTELAIAFKIKTQAAIKGFKTIKDEAKKLKSDIDKLKPRIEIDTSKIKESLKDMKEAIKDNEEGITKLGITAGVVFAGMVVSVNKGLDAYKKYETSMNAVRAVANGMGESFTEVEKEMQRANKLGVLDQANLSQAMKQFLAMGYSAKEAADMIENLTDVAAYNREIHYELAESIRVAAEGFKQELSIKSDATGITENLSQMQERYAKSIGKTAASLTQVEKNEAYYNAVMEQGQIFKGNAIKYSQELAGIEASQATATANLAKAYGEALAPAFSNINRLLLVTTKSLGEFAQEHQTATAFVTTFVTVLVGLVATMGLTIKAVGLLKGAWVAFNAVFMGTPIGWIIAGLAGITAGAFALCGALQEADEKKRSLTEATNLYNDALNNTLVLNDENIEKLKSAKTAAEDYIKIQSEIAKKENEITELGKSRTKGINGRYSYMDEQSFKITALNKEIAKLEQTAESNVNYGKSLEDVRKRLKGVNDELALSETINKGREAVEYSSIKNSKELAAELVNQAKSSRELYNTIQTLQKGTDAYKEAVNNLAGQIPGAVDAQGNLTNVADALITKLEAEAQASWNSSNALVQSNKIALQSLLASEESLSQYATAVGQTQEEARSEIGATILLLEALGKATSGDLITYKPTESPVAPTKTYSNDALDNYKKQLEHKKAMDQISADDEIAGYRYALNQYAKTADEKMALQEKIYSLEKENIENIIELEQKALDTRTKNSEEWIEKQERTQQKSFGIEEHESAYKRIIKYHKDYLDDMLADEKVSLKQKEQIYEQELGIIKEYQERIREARIDSIDNIYDQLTNAIKTNNEKAYEYEKDYTNKKIKLIEKEKTAELEAIDTKYNAKIKAIQDELDALDKAEADKSRKEETRLYEESKSKLENLLKYEHNIINRANIEKQISALNLEYQKQIDIWSLEDKKDTLNEEQELLEEQKSKAIESINEKYNADIEYYNNRLLKIEDNYNKEQEMANQQAQKMLLSIEKYQTDIMNLLETYTDKYELTGQSLGQKLADGFEDKANKIVDVIDSIQTRIDNLLSQSVRSGRSSSSSGSGPLSGDPNHDWGETGTNGIPSWLDTGGSVTNNITINTTDNANTIARKTSNAISSSLLGVV